MSDISLPWKRISRGLPKSRKFADDRAPTIEEISKIVEYPDRRIKAIIYTMASSWYSCWCMGLLEMETHYPSTKEWSGYISKINSLCWRNDEYFTFITAEAYNELEKWKEYRIQSGESVEVSQLGYEKHMEYKEGIY